MFVIGDLLVALANVVHMVLEFYTWVLIASVIISWLRPQVSGDFTRQVLFMVSRLTNPFLAWIRQKLPSALLQTGIDFSPFVALIIVHAANTFITRTLMHWGMSLSMGLEKI